MDSNRGTGVRVSPGKTHGPVEEIRARMERLRESLAGKEEGTVLAAHRMDCHRMERLRESLAGKEEGTILAAHRKDWQRGPLAQWL